MADPDAYVPGTKMTAPPVADQQTRMDIAAYLNRVAGLEGKTYGGPNTVSTTTRPGGQ